MINNNDTINQLVRFWATLRPGTETQKESDYVLEESCYVVEGGFIKELTISPFYHVRFSQYYCFPIVPRIFSFFLSLISVCYPF